MLALVREKYSGDRFTRFGPTLAAEHLASEDGLVVDHETLRRWLLAAGLWQRRRHRSVSRQRRERKAHFGELVQLDGSQHAWLEARGPSGCAMTLVDDATTRVLLQFSRPVAHAPSPHFTSPSVDEPHSQEKTNMQAQRAGRMDWR